MTGALLEQVDFVIEALSGSTNQKHAKERQETLTGLEVAREIATFGPTELPELQPGERRLTFNEFKDLSTFIKSDECDRLLDTYDLRTSLGLDRKFYVDVILKSEDSGFVPTLSGRRVILECTA
jgi:hypothetical protein